MRTRSLAAGTLLAVAAVTEVSACTPHAASISAATAPAGTRSPTAPPGTQPAAATGRITGRAEPCAGLALPPTSPPMTVLVQAHGTAVALQRLPGTGGVYSIALPPGSYVISAPRSEDPPRSITLLARQTRTVNFPNRCK